MADAVPGVGPRDPLAMYLLLRAIAVLEVVVAKKRGDSAVEAVRNAARGEKYDLPGCYLKIVELEAALQPRKRGRKPGPKKPKYGSTGRPRVWTPSRARLLLELLERGKAMLREKGERITNVRALELVIAKDAELQKLPKLRTSGLKALARQLARRVPDCCKVLRK